MYDEDAILRLQQILMFKYVGFSLEEIARLMNPDEKIDVGSMLDKQKELMSGKRWQIDQIIYALDKAKVSCRDNQFDPKNFAAIMQLITKNDMADNRYGFYENLCDSDKGFQRLLEKKKIEFLYHVKARLITENVIKIRFEGPMYVCEK